MLRLTVTILFIVYGCAEANKMEQRISATVHHDESLGLKGENALAVLPFDLMNVDLPITGDPKSFDPPAYCRSKQYPPKADAHRLIQDLTHLSRSGTVVVDFSVPAATVSPLTGLFMSASDISDGGVDPSWAYELKPRLWTTGNRSIEFLGEQFPDLRVNSFLSGDFKEPPFKNFSAWQAHVKKMVGASGKGVPKHFGKGIIWEVWNEPDCIYEWSHSALGGKGYTAEFTFKALFDTYKSAYQVIRSLGGSDETMGGFAWNQYDKDVIGTFLEYALHEGLEVNALVWHELGQTATNLPLIEEHVAEARRIFLNNERYRKLNIQKIVVNESIVKQAPDGQDQRVCEGNKAPECFYPPGEVFAAKAFAENGGANFMSVTNFLTNAPDGTLGARLDAGRRTVTPRGFWWAEKFYADLGSERVPCSLDSADPNSQIVCLATPKSGVRHRSPQVVVAYFAPPNGLNADPRIKSPRPVFKPIILTLKLTSPFAGKRESLGYVKVESIHKIDTTPIGSLPVSYQPMQKAAHSETWTVTLDDLPESFAIDQVLRITPMPGAVVCPKNSACIEPVAQGK